MSKIMFKKESEQKLLFWQIKWLSKNGLFGILTLWNQRILPILNARGVKGYSVQLSYRVNASDNNQNRPKDGASTLLHFFV